MIAHPDRSRPDRLRRLGRASAALALAAALVAPNAIAQKYSYDAAGRLSKVAYDGGVVSTYTYDDLGNLTSSTTGPGGGGGGAGGGGGGGCWIATAAYGSSLDPHVQTLRAFRDAHLLSNAPGRVIWRLYAVTSPPIAAVIERHESLRIAARAVIAPVVLAVVYPRASAGIGALAAACAAVAAVRRWRTRRAP